ncbi:hypothetical protein BASA62_004227 [Batrachochytrium salamandrivorans]|nr:hypothetical protein BASA62_004227 [Batrachochytrium salamandrivorans]
MTGDPPNTANAVNNNGDESVAASKLSIKNPKKPPIPPMTAQNGRYVAPRYMQPRPSSHSTAATQSSAHRQSTSSTSTPAFLAPTTYTKTAAMSSRSMAIEKRPSSTLGRRSHPAAAEQPRKSTTNSDVQSTAVSRITSVVSDPHTKKIPAATYVPNSLNHASTEGHVASASRDGLKVQPSTVKHSSTAHSQSVNADDERLILNARMLQIQLIRLRTQKAFSAQTAAAHTQLKHAAAYIMQLQIQIATQQQQEALRNHLVESVDKLKIQQKSTSLIKAHFQSFTENYTNILSIIEATSKLIRLNGISVPDQELPNTQREFFPSHLNPSELADAVKTSKSEHDSIVHMVKSIKDSVAQCNEETDIAMISLSRKVQQVELVDKVPDIFQ